MCHNFNDDCDYQYHLKQKKRWYKKYPNLAIVVGVWGIVSRLLIFYLLVLLAVYFFGK